MSTPATLSPVAKLRRLESVLRDQGLSLAERVAVADVVLRASRNGVSWPGYRRITADCGVSPDAIHSALAVPGGAAVGRHVEAAGHGPKGVQLFRVLPVPDKEAPSASPSEALETAQRTDSTPPALQSDPAGASVSGVQRFTHQRNISSESVESVKGNLSAPAASIPGSDKGEPDERLLRTIEAATGRKFTVQEARRFMEAVAEARTAGATDPLIAHKTLEHQGGAPWDGPQAAKHTAKSLITDFDAACGFDDKPHTLPQVLKFVRGCAEAERRARENGEPLDNPSAIVSVRNWAASHKRDLDAIEKWPEPKKPDKSP
jgi:hypothetical protein